MKLTIETQPDGILIKLVDEVVREVENQLERQSIVAADAATPPQSALFETAITKTGVPNGLDPTK